MGKGADFSNYPSVIREYTKRTISKPSDGVGAIQGVLSTLESEMGTFPHGMLVELFWPSLTLAATSQYQDSSTS